MDTLLEALKMGWNCHSVAHVITLAVLGGVIFISLLQIRKLRLQEAKKVAVSHVVLAKNFALPKESSLPLASER